MTSRGVILTLEDREMTSALNRYQRSNGGYWQSCLEVEGVPGESRDRGDLRDAMRRALKASGDLTTKLKSKFFNT